MYRDFFGFTEKPFNITPDPRFIFLSKNHREVFAHLLYGLRNRSGFIELIGEVGSGKTTVLRTFLSQLEEESYCQAFIFNPSLSAPELLRGINREFGIRTEGTPLELIEDLNRYLLRQNAAGRTVVLVIDEAQNLRPEVLEQIRLLSNLETDRDKLIQIVLAGQPELGEVLDQRGLRQLRQRITVRYHLLPMDYADTREYIAHRLRIAGGEGKVTFTPGAVKKIFRWSGGYPRLINVLCDRALLLAFTEDSRTVSRGTVVAASRELRPQRSRPGYLRWAALAALGLAFLGGWLLLLRP